MKIKLKKLSVFAIALALVLPTISFVPKANAATAKHYTLDISKNAIFDEEENNMCYGAEYPSVTLHSGDTFTWRSEPSIEKFAHNTTCWTECSCFSDSKIYSHTRQAIGLSFKFEDGADQSITKIGKKDYSIKTVDSANQETDSTINIENDITVVKPGYLVKLLYVGGGKSNDYAVKCPYGYPTNRYSYVTEKVVKVTITVDPDYDPAKDPSNDPSNDPSKDDPSKKDEDSDDANEEQILGNVVLSQTSYVYNGAAKKPTVTAYDTKGKRLTINSQYKVAYQNNVNAGTAKVVVTGCGKCKGTVTKTFLIRKAAQNLKITTTKINVTKKKAKKGTTLAPIKVLGAAGKLTFSKTSGSGKLSINKTTGKIKVKKNTKKGTYKIKVKVKASKTANFSESKPVTKTIKVVVK